MMKEKICLEQETSVAQKLILAGTSQDIEEITIGLKLSSISVG